MEHDPLTSAPAQPITNTTATVPHGQGETKKKVIVAILLVVLLLALVMQPQQPSDEPNLETSSLIESEPRVESRLEDRAMTEHLDELGPTRKLVHTRELSRRGLDVLVTCQAFKTAAAEAVETNDEITRSSQARTPVTVRAIYGSDQDQSAIVNDAIIRRGQALPDGRRVVDVTPRGVTLED